MPSKPALMCICQICNCGRHQCPHKPPSNIMNKSNQPCPLTEYSLQFKRYQAKRRLSFRPPQKPIASDAKMESCTTNRNDYVSHPITPSPPKPNVVYKSPEGAMDGTTEYKELFKGKWAVPAKQIRPLQAKQDNKEPFDHQSTHTVEYVVHTLQPHELHGPKHTHETPKEPFDGTSTVQSDYVDFGIIQPPKSLKPQGKPIASTQAFEGMSCYNDAFTPPPMPARYKRPKQVYTPSDKEFYSDTTFKADFPAHYGIKPSRSLKPPQAKVSSEVPFEGNTTSRMSYTKWDLPSKVSRPMTAYVAPTEKFAVHSTYRKDYPTYGQFDRAKSLKPSQRKEELAPFNGVSSHSNDYKLWTHVERPSSVRLEKRYSPPSERFDAMSTFQAHYTGAFAPRASCAKPQVTPYAKTCAMEASTSYRESYSGSGYQPCPSAALVVDVNKHPGYEYSHQDCSTGHKFFSPTKDSPRISIDTVVA